MNTYEVTVTDLISVTAVVEIEAESAEAAEAKGHKHLAAVVGLGPELYEAAEAHIRLAAHFSHCERGCGADVSGNVWYCRERMRLALEADKLTTEAVKKVRAAT